MSTTRRCITLLILVAVTALAGSVRAIEDGKPDSGHHAVGMLGFIPVFPGFEEPLGFCTGFVISDFAFVTAAHCTATFAPIASSFEVTLEAGSPREPIFEPQVVNLAELDFTPPDINIPIDPILVDTVSPIRVDYCGSPPMLIVPDVAVLVFPRGTFSVQPVRLPGPGFVDELASLGMLGNLPAQLVAYGASERLDDTGVVFYYPGYRQRGLSKLSDPVADPAVDPTGENKSWVFLNPDEIFDANTLSADSGSPLFIQGRAVAIAGQPLGLTIENAYQRLDMPEVLSCLMNYTDS